MPDEDIVIAAVKWSEDEESEEGASSDCISHIVILHRSPLVRGDLNIIGFAGARKIQIVILCVNSS